MRTVALFALEFERSALLYNTRASRSHRKLSLCHPPPLAIQESSKRLYHERLLCKAGPTKAALALLECLLIDTLRWTREPFFNGAGTGGRKKFYFRVGLSCSRSTEIDFKAPKHRCREHEGGRGRVDDSMDSVKISRSDGREEEGSGEGSTNIFFSLFLGDAFTGVHESVNRSPKTHYESRRFQRR